MYSVILMTALATSPTVPDCHGRCGCYGGYAGCYGCYGGCYGGWGGCYGGCYGGGCYGGWGGCYGGYAGYAPAYAAPVKVAQVPAPTVTTTARAKIVIDVPAEAKLYIDDHLTKATSDKRTFDTPTLNQGQAYFYEMRAEVVRDGKTYSETKRIQFKAGETVQASFPQLVAQLREADKTVASAR
ncbi:MAG: TIGR03000 domain-containing protein [Gemmataceae bacterium]|nr:TIGR03000 domain-containing protein [Gemmataceae bacterium]